MKIAFIHHWYEPYEFGGGERDVRLLAEALTEKGHEVTVYTTSPGNRVKKDVLNGVEVHYIPPKNIYWDCPTIDRNVFAKSLWHFFDAWNPLMVQRLKREMVTKSFDIAHTFGITGFSCCAWQMLKKMGLPIVQTLFSYFLMCPRATMYLDGANCKEPCVAARIQSFPAKYLSKHVSAVVGISHFVSDRYREQGYFPNALRKTIYDPRRLPNAKKKTKTDKFRVGFLGRLHPTKGVERLLEAGTSLSSLDLHMYIGGEGRPKYERFLKQKWCCENIDFLGYVNPSGFFEKIDVLVVPSLWHEPSGGVIIEAYGHGVPVIVSNRGGMPEIVEQGRTGYVFNIDRQDDLRRLLKRLVTNPNQLFEMQDACFLKANQFLPEKIAQQYEAVYEESMGNREDL